jgi:hypothetical protein
MDPDPVGTASFLRIRIHCTKFEDKLSFFLETSIYRIVQNIENYDTYDADEQWKLALP